MTIPRKAPAPASQRESSNLTEGPIGRTLITFALPILGANALQSLNGLVNAIWVSHILGENALTALANANTLLLFLVGAIFGTGMAINVLVAQSAGAGDREMIKRIVGTGIVFFASLSLLLAALGFEFAPDILAAMKTPPEAQIAGATYLRVIFIAMPFMNFFTLFTMIQRGLGDSQTPFVFLAISVALDVALNPLLIIGVGPVPRMGIAGAATSTLVAQAGTLLFMVVHLHRRKISALLRPEDWRKLNPELRILKALVVKGLPMGLQMIVLSGAALLTISLVNQFGSRTAAAFGAVSQVWTYVQMPAIALGAAISSMIAQNIGGGRWDRVSRIALVGIGLGLTFTTTLVGLIYAAGNMILRLFLPPGTEAISIAAHIESIALWPFAFFSIAFLLSGAVRAAGSVWPPLLIQFFSLWIVRIPFAIALIPRLEADAIWWSFPVGIVMSSVLCIAYYRYGGWRRARMIDPDPRQPIQGPGTVPLSPSGALTAAPITLPLADPKDV